MKYNNDLSDNSIVILSYEYFNLTFSEFEINFVNTIAIKKYQVKILLLKINKNNLILKLEYYENQC